MTIAPWLTALRPEGPAPVDTLRRVNPRSAAGRAIAAQLGVYVPPEEDEEDEEDAGADGADEAVVDAEDGADRLADELPDLEPGSLIVDDEPEPPPPPRPHRVRREEELPPWAPPVVEPPVAEPEPAPVVDRAAEPPFSSEAQRAIWARLLLGPAPTYELADLASVRTGTVSRVLGGWVEGGWVERLGEGDRKGVMGRLPTWWGLAGRGDAVPSTLPPRLSRQEADVLGYLVVIGGWVPTTEVRRALCLAETRTSDALRRLQDIGVAKRDRAVVPGQPARWRAVLRGEP